MNRTLLTLLAVGTLVLFSLAPHETRSEAAPDDAQPVREIEQRLATEASPMRTP